VNFLLAMNGKAGGAQSGGQGPIVSAATAATMRTIAMAESAVVRNMMLVRRVGGWLGGRLFVDDRFERVSFGGGGCASVEELMSFELL
jgi:hypothetical protein